jgi:hypothetical protein
MPCREFHNFCFMPFLIRLIRNRTAAEQQKRGKWKINKMEEIDLKLKKWLCNKIINKGRFLKLCAFGRQLWKFSFHTAQGEKHKPRNESHHKNIYVTTLPL